jgi:hypothetical protein
VTYKLAEGATTCEDGVIATYTCTDCNASYTNTYTYHQTFEVGERIEFTSTCGGYAVEMFIPLATAKIVDGTIGMGFQCVNDTNASFYNGQGDMWYSAYETLPTYTIK